MKLRPLRIAEEIRKIISEFLVYEASDKPKAFITIHAVQMNDDLTCAKVYYSAYEDNADRKAIDAFFRQNAYPLKKRIGQEIRLKFIPQLVFVYDDSVKKAAHIDGILKAELKDK